MSRTCRRLVSESGVWAAPHEHPQTVPAHDCTQCPKTGFPPDPKIAASGCSSPAPSWPGRRGLGQRKQTEQGTLVITGRGRPTLPGAERYTPGATCAAASPRGHGRLPGETEVGYPGALTTSRPLPRAISDRRVHDPEHGPSRGSVLPGVLGEGKGRSQAWDPVFPSSPARHARPLATVTLRGAKPVGRLRLHLRRQCVLEPCAQQSRSLSSRRYLVQVLNPRGGARGAEPKGQPARLARPFGQ